MHEPTHHSRDIVNITAERTDFFSLVEAPAEKMFLRRNINILPDIHPGTSVFLWKTRLHLIWFFGDLSTRVWKMGDHIWGTEWKVVWKCGFRICTHALEQVIVKNWLLGIWAPKPDSLKSWGKSSVRKQKCFHCSPFYGRACRWAILGALKP